jgi:hypothetical protein
MIETILLICLIAVLLPVMLILVFAWNLRRRMQGLSSLEGVEALKEFFKNLEQERKQQDPQKTENQKGNLSAARQENRKSAKTIVQSGKNVEDAEFKDK